MDVTDEPCPYCGKARKVLPKHQKKSEWMLSLQSYLPSTKLAPIAAPKDDQAASDEPPPITSTSSTTSYRHPYLSARSPLERLPLEIREHICQLIRLNNSHPAPRWAHYVKWEDRHQPCNRRRCCQKSLCTLSLVSKSMAAPAQRALFENIVLDKPRTLVYLCKSLLLYPKNRGYIRHIAVKYDKYMGQREPYDVPGDRHSHPYDKPDASAFVNLLGPVVMEQGASCPWATDFLRQAYLSYHERPGAAGVSYSAEAFKDLTDAIFGLVVNFSPSLQSLALSGSGKPWMQPFQYQKKLFLYHSPPMTTLSLDLSVLQILFGSPETGYSDNWHPCLSTVQSLTLKGFDLLEVRGLDDAAMCLGSLFDWFCMKPRLRRLEINGYDETLALESNHNWNTILPLFKDTLEHLSMSGYMEPISEDQMTDRFGPARMLTCLPELEKLAYLKVPLHFVSSHRPQLIPDMAHAAPPGDADSGDSDTNNDNNHQDPITARKIHQQIMVELPPSLKTVDIIEYVNHRESRHGMYDRDEIQVRDKFRLRL